MSKIKKNSVSILFFVLSVLSFLLSGISGKYLTSEIYIRFIRNMLFILALILPIMCGMGINFAIIVGSVSAQAAIVFSIDLGITGARALLFVILVSFGFSILFGNMVANLLNKARGKEMIVSILIGQLSSVVYQFVFMVCYGLVFQPANKEILLDRGIGVRSMLDAKNISEVFKGLLPFTFDGKVYSFFPVVIIIIFSIIHYFIEKSKLGNLARAVGEDIHTAEKLGINSNRIRKICIIISTIFPSMSQILFVSNMGSINVYTGHLGIDIFAAAAILVGGATLKRANMKNCFIGVILFHTLFVTSAMAGQRLFNNPAVGEYFRSFVAYATIVIALILNLKSDENNYRLSLKNLMNKIN